MGFHFRIYISLIFFNFRNIVGLKTVILHKGWGFSMKANLMNTVQSLQNNLLLPELVVFDLDMCLWSPEMYTLDEIPTQKDIVIGNLYRDSVDPQLVEGVVGVKSGHEVISLFPAAILILRRFYMGYYGDKFRIAAASSADTPLAVSIGRAAMALLEVLPGVSVRDVFAKGWPKNFEGNLQIGRQPPLSANKAQSHFPILRSETGKVSALKT